MKKLLFTLSILFLGINAQAQRYDIITQDICWNTGSVDSSLTRYLLVSPLASTVKVLAHLNSAGQKVTPNGGTFSAGHCGCCGGGSGSEGAGTVINANSGVYLDGDTVILGGTIKMNTVINGMGTYGLDLTNLKYLTLSAQDSVNLITPDLIAAAAKVGGVLQLNSVTGRVEFTPYAFPFHVGVNGQFMSWDEVGDSLKWTSPYITAMKTDSSYRFSVNGSTVSEVLFPNGSTYISQVHVDSSSAIPFDGLNDDSGFESAFSTLKANGYRTLKLSPGGEYNIKDISWSNTSFDSTMIVIDLNGSVITFDTTNTQNGNILMSGVENVMFINGTMKGRVLPSYAYDKNHSFVHISASRNISFQNVHFIYPYSHAVSMVNHQLTGSTEKLGVVFDNCEFNYHLSSLINADSSHQFSYILAESGAEYNKLINNKAFNGFQFYRSIGGANDLIGNNTIELFNNPFYRLDSAYQSGILYFDTIPSGNCGKFIISDNIINHNGLVTPILLRQNKNLATPRIAIIAENQLLVNGADTRLSELIRIENSPYTKINNNILRPRQNAMESAIGIINSPYTTLSNVDILGTINKTNGIQAENSKSIYIDNCYFDVNNVMDPDGYNSSISYLNNPPLYESFIAVNQDTFLAEGSLYRLEGESMVSVKDSNAINTADKPYLTFDDSTWVAATAINSSQYTVRIDDDDIPNTWLTKYFKMEMRFKFDTLMAASNELFGAGASQGLGIDWETGSNNFEITVVQSPSIVNDQVSPIPIVTDTWYVLRAEFAPDDTLRIYINDTLVNNFEAPNWDFSQATGYRYWGGLGSNAAVGFNGVIDYIQWRPYNSEVYDRVEFGNFDPVVWETTGTPSGTNYRTSTIIADDFQFDIENGRLKMSLSDVIISTDDQTASEVPITDAGNFFDDTEVESALQTLADYDTVIYVNNNDILTWGTILDRHKNIYVVSQMNSSSTSDNDLVFPAPTTATLGNVITVFSRDLDNGFDDNSDTAISSSGTIRKGNTTLSGYTCAGGEVIEMQAIDIDGAGTIEWQLSPKWDGWTSTAVVSTASPIVHLERKNKYIFDAATQGLTTNTLEVSDLEPGDEILILILGADGGDDCTIDLSSGDIIYDNLSGDATEVFTNSRLLLRGIWTGTDLQLW